MHGFLLIDKEPNMTSHDVLKRLKRKLHVDKIGHTGTLDPFATGLMIVCVGDACKLASHFSGLDKSYEGTFIFGKAYDTLDVTGQVTESNQQIVTKESLIKACLAIKDIKSQIPPMYAAIKKDGKKLYEYARKNIEVHVEPRPIDIYELDIKASCALNEFSFYSFVSKGTYIRAIARDLGEHLNTFGALKTLRRLSVGNFNVSSAVQIDQVDLEKDLFKLETYLDQYPNIVLNDYLIKLVKNGIVLDERQVITSKPFTVKDQTGKLIAYYEVTDHNQYKPVIIIKDS